MDYIETRRRIANYDDRAYTEHTYAIHNEFGVIAIVYADHVQDAFDAAADAGALDSEKLSDEDYAEHIAEGWDDSYVLLGNASEPFASTYLGITELERKA